MSKLNKLTEGQVAYYSKRLIHYLKGTRRRNGYSQEEVAHLLRLSLSHYRKMETEGYVNDGKTISAIDTLIELGELSGMNLHQFALYLDNPKDLTFDEFIKVKDEAKRELGGFEKKLIALFDLIDDDTRLEFSDIYLSNESDNSKLLRMVKISIFLHELFFKKFSDNQSKLFDAIFEIVYTEFLGKVQARVTRARTFLKNLL